jgi:hypothetical protein
MDLPRAEIGGREMGMGFSVSSRIRLLMKIIPVLLAVLLLCSCKYELPAVDSGSIELHANGSVVKGDLSAAQISMLQDWLKSHQTGWEFKVEDRYPEMLVFLKRRGETVAVVDIRKTEIAVKNLVTPITEEDRAKLVLMLASFITRKSGV